MLLFENVVIEYYSSCLRVKFSVALSPFLYIQISNWIEKPVAKFPNLLPYNPIPYLVVFSVTPSGKLRGTSKMQGFVTF